MEALSRHPVVRTLAERVRESVGLTFLFVSGKGHIAGLPPGKYMQTTNALCARICTDRKKGMKLCLSAATDLLSKKQHTSGDFVQRPCHLGLQTLGAPIVFEGQTVGLVAACGFMRAEHVFEEEQSVAHRAARQGWSASFDEALGQLRETPSLNVREVRLVADLMQLLIEQVVHASRSSEAEAEVLKRALTGLELACPDVPFVGTTPEMRALRTIAERSAPKRLPTLITGPAGAGASHLSRHLHRAGGFARTPFIAVEARDGVPVLAGLCRQGVTGTFVVEHLEQASAATRAQLVELVRKTPDTFWISTTRAPVDAAELGVLSLTLPSLAQRSADIGPLAESFLGAVTLPSAVASALTRYDWPGHVVELEAVIRRARSLGGLTLANLPPEIARRSAKNRRAAFHDDVLQFKTELVANALARTNGNVSHAARELGLQRTYLHRLMNELGVRHERD